MLLAVDMGLRLGLALYGGDGRLRWYRSSNVGTPERLRRAAWAVVRGEPELTALVIEGGGPLAEVWIRLAFKQGLTCLQLGAERWREQLLLPRQQRSGAEAKRHAGDLARRVIAWSGLPGATSLRHDAAEAILAGLWGCLQLGWLPELPAELRS